jgi:hypothetical protein
VLSLLTRCLTANRVTGTFRGTLQWNIGAPYRVALLRLRTFSSIKAFADHLFALLPKLLGALRIQGVRLHTLTQARG